MRCLSSLAALVVVACSPPSEVLTRETTPQTSTVSAIAPEPPVVMAEFSTPLLSYQRNRNRNVALAGGTLAGAILPPGGTLSFNDAVGPRTLEAGYLWASVIENGEIATGIGGGVCQVASTLNAAALFAGLEYEEVHNHSRVVSYIDAGLDAAVTSTKDLRIRNPYDFAIRVEVDVEENQSITVRLIGARAGPCVEVRRWSTSLPGRGIFVDLPEWTAAEPYFVGKTVFRERHMSDGTRAWMDRATLRYPFSPRVIHLPPGTSAIEAEFDHSGCANSDSSFVERVDH